MKRRFLIALLTFGEPQVGAPATERTVLRAVFTNTHLYIGVMAYDSEPSAIIANEMERTYITNDHWYRVPETWWHGVADVGDPLNSESTDG